MRHLDSDDGLALDALSRLQWATTGVGSLPLGDPAVAARMSVQECPQLPFVPELPSRGPGADVIGRTAGWLSSVVGDFGVETTASGWRLASGRGRDMRRATSWLHQDLEAIEVESVGYEGPLKVSLAGPWTLAAAIEDATGERTVRDPGFVRDLGEALGLAGAALVGDLGWRVPGATVALQWDEPGLAAVRAGSLRSASGLRRLSPVEDPDLIAALVKTLDGVGAVPQLVHVCSRDVPWPVLAALPVAGVSVDWALHQQSEDGALGGWLESGRGMVAGVWPTDGSDGPAVRDSARAVLLEPLHRLGIDPAAMRGWTALSARCGLAGAPPESLRAGFAALTDLGRRLREGGQ